MALSYNTTIDRQLTVQQLNAVARIYKSELDALLKEWDNPGGEAPTGIAFLTSNMANPLKVKPGNEAPESFKVLMKCIEERRAYALFGATKGSKAGELVNKMFDNLAVMVRKLAFQRPPHVQQTDNVVYISKMMASDC